MDLADGDLFVLRLLGGSDPSPAAYEERGDIFEMSLSRHKIHSLLFCLCMLRQTCHSLRRAKSHNMTTVAGEKQEVSFLPGNFQAVNFFIKVCERERVDDW